MIPTTAHGWRVMLAFIAIIVAPFLLLSMPAHRAARPDFNCNNKPPCCNNEKHWNHKYDCER